jgi:hypothetical protein
MGKMITQEHLTLVWQTTRMEEARITQTSRKTEEVTSDGWIATRGAQRIEGNSLVLLQVNCRRGGKKRVKLSLGTLPTGCGCSVGTVHLRTKTTEFSLVLEVVPLLN